MKYRKRRRGARYYRGSKPKKQTVALKEPPTPQDAKPLSFLRDFEWIWLFLVILSFLLMVAFSVRPVVEWPRNALYTGGAAALGLLSLSGFFATYYLNRR